MSGRCSINSIKNSIKRAAAVLPALLTALAFTAAPGLSQTGAGLDAGHGGGKDKNVPIVITSKVLTTDNKKHTALFTGAVKTVKGEVTLYCDEMLVYYTSPEENNRRPVKTDAGDKSSGSGKIKQIDANGSVKLVKENQTVTSKKAVYFADEDKVIFTGNPVAKDGKNVVTGTKMTYYMSDDRSIVENSRVLLIEEEKENKTKPEGKAAPNVKPGIKPNVKPDVRQELEPDVRQDIKPDSEPNVKPDVKPELEPDVKPDLEPDVKNDSGGDGDEKPSGRREAD
jgi:lipopolysaccharide export system protein LptA